MSSARTGRRNRRFAAASACALILPLLGVAATPAAAASSSSKTTLGAGRYIVSFADEPAASYTGGVSGYPGTRPPAGKKLDPTRPEVVRYRARLNGLHDQALSGVGATKLYDYSVTTNGVAAELTAAQATALARTAGVARMEKDAKRTVATVNSPAYLGLTAPGGLWSQLGGNTKAGEGVIVGVLDTGIWPESASFAGQELKRDRAGQPVAATGLRGRWFGACVQGQQFNSQNCNDKLIGARYYVDGFGKRNISKAEYLSPRDGDGHGSHTASTAAGNRVPDVVVDGIAFGTASGMAPGADVAAYKVCWTGGIDIDDGCMNSDIVAAIGDAVADGVDVINMSIGAGSESSVLDAAEQAFRAASNAGVFVANSAGNSGPEASTLDHPSPWLTTVAASTFHANEAVLVLGSGTRVVGASVTPLLPSPTTLVAAAAIKTAAATPADAARCFAGTLDAALAAGKVVLCERGVNGRVQKASEVKRAGGSAMVLMNVDDAGETVADLHPLPAIHVSFAGGKTVRAYLASAGAAATASIQALADGDPRTAVPSVAGFSSRGPSTTTEGDILKPDIAAPGVDVLAAVAPPFHSGRSFDFESGTSMSSPHVAGLGALLKAAHPAWSAAAVKSALMTTAVDTVKTTDPFAQGAGFVTPNSAVDPGLVFDTPAEDYRRYLVGLGMRFSAYPGLTALDASDINLASVATGAMAGSQKVKRAVTNVGTADETYTVASDVQGIAVSTPSITVAKGETKDMVIALSRTTAPLGAWAKGHLTLRGSLGHVVRLPVAIRPVAVAAPAQLSGATAGSSASLSVTPGFSGALTTTAHGLVGATPVAASVVTGPFDVDAPAVAPATKAYTITLPAGTPLARFDVDATSAADDLDLFVYRDGTLVGASASGSGDEQVTLHDPAAGVYTAYVNGYATTGGGGYAYTQWAVPHGPGVGALAVAPSPTTVTAGQPVTLTVTWGALPPGQRYLGFLSYSGPEGAAADRSIVAIG